MTEMKKIKQRVDKVWWELNRGSTLERDRPEEQIKQTEAKSNRKRQDKIQSSSPAESPVFWKGKSPLWTEAIPTSPDRV